MPGAFALPGLVLLMACGQLPENVSLGPGQAAPAWVDLVGTDGAKHSLADLKDRSAVVVVFFATSCPDSLAYEERLISLARDYAQKSVAVVLLNVSRLPDDDLRHMTERARRKQYPFPFLFDPTQKIGIAYAARVTPTVFVLDRTRKVAYRGGVDDNFTASRVERRYVREALDALLAGKPVPTPEAESIGCDIEYEPMPAK